MIIEHRGRGYTVECPLEYSPNQFHVTYKGQSLDVSLHADIYMGMCLKFNDTIIPVALSRYFPKDGISTIQRREEFIRHSMDNIGITIAEYIDRNTQKDI